MEIDPAVNMETSEFYKTIGVDQSQFKFMSEVFSSIPGIDEATSFGEVIRSIETYNFDLVIFDTAPTGHTLKLLNFLNLLQKALVKMM